MQQILIRGLRRSFRIDGAPAGGPFEALRAEPAVAVAPRVEAIALARAGSLWSMTLPGGLQLHGALEGLAAELDVRLVRDACARESDALALPGSVLEAPDGRRLVLLAQRHPVKTAAVLDLMQSGWRCEGDALVFARRAGFCAYPQAIRIDEAVRRWVEPLAAVDLSCLGESFDGQWRALQPDAFGQPWRIGEAPADAILLAEFNVGGRMSHIRKASRDEVFARALSVAAGTPTAASLSALMLQVSACPAYRLQVGDPASLVRAARILSRFRP